MKEKLVFSDILNRFPANSLANVEGIKALASVSDKYFVTCDYKRFNAITLADFPFDVEAILNALDYDNSNVYCWSNFTFQKVKFLMGPGLIASVVYDNKSFPIFSIVKNNNENSVIDVNYIIDLYSSFFVIKSLSDDYDILEDMYYVEEVVKNFKMTRYDLAFDFCWYKYVLLPKMTKLVKTRTGTDFRMYYDNGSLSSWSYGSRNNKRIFVRCYDKKLDTLKKGKSSLFPMLNDFISVYRLEFQFGPNSFFIQNDLDISDYEKQKFRDEYFARYGVPVEMKTAYRKKILGYCKKLYNTGMDLQEFMNDILRTCELDTTYYVKLVKKGAR